MSSETALFCECRCSPFNRRQLQARGVRWRNETRNECFVLAAKSIEGRDDLIEEGYRVCDLRDSARLSAEFMGRRGG